MNTQDSLVPIDAFHVAGVLFETSVELDTPDTPLIFVKISEANTRLVSAKFATDPKSLEGIANRLKQTAKESKKQGAEFSGMAKRT